MRIADIMVQTRMLACADCYTLSSSDRESVAEALQVTDIIFVL